MINTYWQIDIMKVGYASRLRRESCQVYVCMNIPQVEDHKCLAKNNFVGPLCQVKLSGYACSAYKSKINVLYLYLFCRQCGEHDLALLHQP